MTSEAETVKPQMRLAKEEGGIWRKWRAVGREWLEVESSPTYRPAWPSKQVAVNGETASLGIIRGH